ncbi:MAG: zinc ribbon domain-containing protein [Candidatus Zixiibacteriota bacterium]|nr:MAG: zinc ribbon domain-containing protein [candidate division Zixibacteria bacterium]
MPTYDYRCLSCGFEFEEFQSIVAESLTVCPKCGGRLQRLISGGAGLIFKGAGFYETDYKRKSTAGSSPSTKPEKKENKAAESTSGDT